jgi:hypothetical protein
MSSKKDGDPRPMTAARKAERERDAVQATKEYHAEKARIDANMERLRALRLAKAAAATVAPAPKAGQNNKKKSRKSV